MNKTNPNWTDTKWPPRGHGMQGKIDIDSLVVDTQWERWKRKSLANANKLKMRNRIAITVLVLFSIFCFWKAAYAATPVTKQINFEWEYDTTKLGLAGYILYQNGKVLHTVNSPTTLTVDISVAIEPGKTEVFTMKAFDIDKEESQQSEPYNLVVPTAIRGDNFTPVAMLTYVAGSVFNKKKFTAIGSTDFDGTVVGYKWDWGDGTPAGTTQDATHLFTKAGNFTVTLTVTDDKGGVGVTTAKVMVKDLLVIPKRFKASRLR